MTCPHVLLGTPGPWVVFSAVAAEIRELGDSDPRWRGITGVNSKELEAAVVAFNTRKIDGLALTYSVGSMGIRLKGAKTLALIGSADAGLMAQAARRAPGAQVVFL